MRSFFKIIKSIHISDHLIVKTIDGTMYKFKYADIKRVYISFDKSYKSKFRFSLLFIFLILLISIHYSSHFILIDFIFFATIIYLIILNHKNYNLIIEYEKNYIHKFIFSNSIKYNVINSVQLIRKKISKIKFTD
jgi:hypothetical protein